MCSGYFQSLKVFAWSAAMNWMCSEGRLPLKRMTEDITRCDVMANVSVGSRGCTAREGAATASM